MARHQYKLNYIILSGTSTTTGHSWVQVFYFLPFLYILIGGNVDNQVRKVVNNHFTHCAILISSLSLKLAIICSLAQVRYPESTLFFVSLQYKLPLCCLFLILFHTSSSQLQTHLTRVCEFNTTQSLLLASKV